MRSSWQYGASVCEYDPQVFGKAAAAWDRVVLTLYATCSSVNITRHGSLTVFWVREYYAFELNRDCRPVLPFPPSLFLQGVFNFSDQYLGSLYWSNKFILPTVQYVGFVSLFFHLSLINLFIFTFFSIINCYVLAPSPLTVHDMPSETVHWSERSQNFYLILFFLFAHPIRACVYFCYFSILAFFLFSINLFQQDPLSFPPPPSSPRWSEFPVIFTLAMLPCLF